jgi:hypothetical protein
MKHYSSIFLLSLFSLILMGCQQKSSKPSNSSSTNPVCVGSSYFLPGCPGHTGGTTGGTVTCNPPQYGQTQCQNYCQYFNCNTTTGGSTGGNSGGVNCNPSMGPVHNTCPNYCQINPSASGCLPNGTNCNSNPSASGCPGSSGSIDGNNYGSNYPQGVPANSCSTPYASGSNSYDTRKGTMTIVGGSWYNPADPSAPNYLNTSSMLKSVSEAKLFFMTDSVVKVRFKVRPMPESTSNACYGRTTGSTIPGYTKLKFNVLVKGVNSNNTLTGEDYVGTYETGVNACTQGLDLSYYKAKYPNGFVVLVSSVQGNQGCSNYDYNNGFKNCNVWKNIRTIDCWSLDMEVAADGTKTFD